MNIMSCKKGRLIHYNLGSHFVIVAIEVIDLKINKYNKVRIMRS